MADEIEQINKILSAPTGGTGDDVYAGAIDPREVGVDALNAGALTDEEFMMAEEFVNSLPPEDKPGFMELFIAKPREALNAVMDTLRQVFDREEAITGENYISYDSEGNATIGQPSISKSSGPATAFRGTDLYSDYRSYPDTVRGQDDIKRRTAMDMGQPAVARRIVDGGEYEDYNDPENDAILDRGRMERGRFQQQEIDGRLGALTGRLGAAVPDEERRKYNDMLKRRLGAAIPDEERRKYEELMKVPNDMLNRR